MKKAQLTIILIIGLLFIIIATFVFVRVNQSKKNIIETSSSQQQSFEFNKENFQDYFNQCSRNSIINANEEFGIRQSNKKNYENYVSLKIKYCMDPLLNEFKKSNYSIDEGSVRTTVAFNEKTISVNVDYPIKISKEDIDFDFENYKITFPRENYISIVNMDDQEILLPSTDKRVQIIVPAETSIIDKHGNSITSLSIKLIDKNFDGLENKVVVGNLIYEIQPKGAKFSKPIELSIDFRNKDIPQTVNENSLSIAWWDSNVKIWKSLPTTIKNGRAIARVDHLTKFAVVAGCTEAGEYEISTYIPNIYSQQYDDKKAWIKSKKGQIYTTGDVEESQQLLSSEKIIFGIDENNNDDYCDGFIETECCCSAHEEIIGIGDKKIGCSAVPLGECNGEIAEDDEMYYQEDIDSCNENKKGYDDYNCLGGIIKDNDGDNAVFKIVFEENGNSCFKNYTIDAFPGKDNTCEITADETIAIDIFTGKPAINIQKIKVTRNKPENDGIIETTTNCSLKVTLIGVGAKVQFSGIYEYNLTRECSIPGEYGYLETGGIATCAICSKDEFGNMYYKPIDITECCGSDNEGVAYCPGVISEQGKICKKVGNTYQFEDWYDEKCDYCCSDACKFGSSDCPEKNNECDIVTCVD